jgi:hypothetical protein
MLPVTTANAMSAIAAPLDADPKQAWTRLGVACALSIALHCALLLGVPVNPTGGVPNVSSMIEARLETSAVETVAETALPDHTAPAEAMAIPPLTEDPLAAPEPRKADAQPESKPAAPPPSSPSAGIEVPLIRDPTYYTAKELFPFLPTPLAESKEYMEAGVARLNVSVRVLLLIDEFGIVKDASVLEAHPPEHAEAVRSLFSALRFSPGLIHGRAVKARVVINARPISRENEGRSLTAAEPAVSRPDNR